MTTLTLTARIEANRRQRARAAFAETFPGEVAALDAAYHRMIEALAAGGESWQEWAQRFGSRPQTESEAVWLEMAEAAERR